MHRKSFGVLSKRAVPSTGLMFSCICLLSGVVLIYLIPNVMTVFTLVTTVSAILFMFIWSIILCSYLTYRKKRPQLHAESSYKMPLGIFMCWICLAFFAFVIVLLTLQPDTRQALIVTPLWFVVLAIAYQFIRRKKQAVDVK